mmetsp:Transcript_27753/g.61126  ORF Transcript_27753/g.61126 Transcript_27753/m.61126 type:complete len:210 (-) Transcript_27753:166-795(-)
MPKIDPTGEQSRIGSPSPNSFDSVGAVVFVEPLFPPSLDETFVGISCAQDSHFRGRGSSGCVVVTVAFGFRELHIGNLRNIKFFFPLQKGAGRFRGHDSSIAVRFVRIHLIAGNLKDGTNEPTACAGMGIVAVAAITVAAKIEFFCREGRDFFGFHVGESALKKDGCRMAKDPSVSIRYPTETEIAQVGKGRPRGSLAEQAPQTENGDH